MTRNQNLIRANQTPDSSRATDRPSRRLISPLAGIREYIYIFNKNIYTSIKRPAALAGIRETARGMRGVSCLIGGMSHVS
jgi:hypothetical protein